MLQATLNEVFSAAVPGERAPHPINAPSNTAALLDLRWVRMRFPWGRYILGDSTCVIETQNHHGLLEQDSMTFRAPHLAHLTVDRCRHRHFHRHRLDEEQGIARFDALALRGR